MLASGKCPSENRGVPKAQFLRTSYTESSDPEKTSSRDCLENPNVLHFGVPGVGKTREEAPSLPLCTTENTRSRPVLLFSKQILSEGE